MRTRRGFVSALVAVVALFGVSCTAPTTTPEKWWDELCAPADWPGASFFATPVVVPPEGAWLTITARTVTLSPEGWYDDVGVSTRTYDDELVAGHELSLGHADPGLCIHLTWQGGLHFTVASVPLPRVGPPSILGWPPGWIGPSDPF